jgi:2-keto-4-pentenoate hydratase/2-oxohepta-3-ene-1,7-dioic acid hydratase in catechol pathway
MTYQHLNHKLEPLTLPAGKVVCIGRNYAAHAQELGNEVPDRPVIFIKPSTSLVNWEHQIAIPTDRGECHHELELAILIGKRLTKANKNEANQAIAGITLALDLTLRDVQKELKQKGHPWEMAKAFDGACPVARWHELPSVDWLNQAKLQLVVNGQLRQKGSSELMLWPPLDLLCYVSRFITLCPGDLLLTGTPAGVNKLEVGDQVQASLEGILQLDSEVIAGE